MSHVSVHELRWAGEVASDRGFPQYFPFLIDLLLISTHGIYSQECC